MSKKKFSDTSGSSECKCRVDLYVNKCKRCLYIQMMTNMNFDDDDKKKFIEVNNYFLG